MYGMYKLLPIFVLLALSLAIINFLPVRRYLAYKLGFSGDTTRSCCSKDEVMYSTGDFDQNASHAIFDGRVIDYPKTSLAQALLKQPLMQRNVLGAQNAENGERWIEVSLEEQKLRAWEGNSLVTEFLISSGKWAPTPKGDFKIWYKTRSQTMSGGSKKLGTYYYLPNVPSNMFFYDGYAIHGAYWHNNFGTPMSHGCVNSPLASVAELFDWAGPVVPEGVNAIRASADNPGTRVYIH